MRKIASSPTQIHWILTVTIALSTVTMQRNASAFPFYDPFADKTGSGGSSYAAGAALATQNDSSGNVWNLVGSTVGTVEPLIAGGNLTYTNMPKSSGNSVSFAGAVGKGDRLNFNQVITMTNTRAYFSYLLKITDLTVVSSLADSNFFSGFSDGNAGQTGPVLRVGARPVVKKSGTGYVLGMSRNNNAADNVYDTNVFNVNDTVFVVGSYDRIGGVTNVNMWINPPISSFGSNVPPAATVAVPTVSGTFTGDINTSGGGLIQGFLILCQNATAPSGIIDDVRIGTNWSYVTGGDPSVLTSPTNRTVAPGNSATFAVTARGTGSLSYQWYKNGTTQLSDGGNILGSSSATLTLNNVAGGDSGSYSAFVTNGLGAFAQSGSAVLTVLTDPLITNQPQNVTTNANATAIFQVGATGTAPLTYQWHKQGSGDLIDGGNISGSHSNILAISSLSFPDGGTYFVTVSNASGVSVDSANAMLTVIDPYITSNPTSVTTNAGAVANFHVVAGGTGGFNYEWLKNGSIIFGGGNISGPFTDTLTISNVSSTDQAGYSVVVIGTYGSVTSSVANLTVLSPVSIPAQPRARTVVIGSRAAFSVGAAGTGPFTYQWQREGTNIPGANSSAYILTNVQPTMNGNYSVVVSNAFSSISSSVVSLNAASSLSLAETNLVIIRVGDGAQTLGLNGNSMFLDQYLVDGTYVNTITVPETGPAGLVTIGQDNLTGINSGSTTGSGLTRSLDGRFMVIAGYNTNLNYGSSLATSSSTNVPKGIATIDSNGQYSLAVASTNTGFDGSLWRCGITDGTNNFWGSANIFGTYYFGFGSPPALVQNTMANMRSMALFNGDIYAVGAGSPNGVLKLSGMPRTNVTTGLLFTGSSGSFDLTVSPSGNIIYVTDQRNATSNGGGIQRYDFNGTSWSLSYTLNTGFGTLGPRYISTDFSGPNPILYVTSNDQTFDNNRLIKVVDTGVGSAGTTLASAGANQTFRSLRFGPVRNFIVPAPTLSFTRQASNLVLSWAGTYTLQASTNVGGAYVDVTPTSPFTNSIGSEPARFFRLRQ